MVVVEMVAQHPSSWAEHPAVNPWAGTGTGGTDRGTGGGQALSRAVCPGTGVAVVTAQCVPSGGGTMAGSCWKSDAALESLMFHDATRKGASHMKRVLGLNPALSPGEKTELTDLNSDHGTSALWNCFSAGVLSLLPSHDREGKTSPV